MESSVRYVQLENAGFKPALCFRGKKVAHCVINDESSVRTISITLQDHDKARIVQRLGQDYFPKTFAMQMKTIGERKGITKRAQFLLVSGEKTESEDDIDKIPDEVESPGMVIPEFSLPMSEVLNETKTAKRETKQASSETAPPKLTVVSGGLGERKPPRKVSVLGSLQDAAKMAQKPAVEPPRKPTPILSLVPPRLAKAPPSTTAKKVAVPKAEQPKSRKKATLVAKLAKELGIAEQPLRVRLRAAGLRAPYDDEAKMRKALGLTGGKK